VHLTTTVIFGFIINGKIIRVVVVLKGLQCGDIRQKVGKKCKSKIKIKKSKLIV
jgi:hypothetical protein